MSEIWRRRSLHVLFCFLSSLLLQSFSGLADDPASSKNSSKSDSHTPSIGANTGSKVLIIFLAIVAVGLFSFFLFKIWQKKKREEQYVRLLKLFEEDDELEDHMAVVSAPSCSAALNRLLVSKTQAS
ncbi:hypothetical protein RJ641_018763 [Dillenia turbinata]|uniref:Uncharacterized protein n=1 Tax=Dillenia turbinata TaxID=194707 RepID=A0AAN8YWX1_9MAGN